MKKILAIILSLIFVLTFAACGGKDADEGKGDSNNPSASTGEEGYYFTTPNGVKVEIDVLAKDTLDAIGGNPSYEESTSCAFEGLDKTYGFGGYYITTSPDGDKDYIYSAWFVDDSVTTAEGIYVGSSKADVEAAYGAGCIDGDSATLTKGNTELVIILEDDAVVEIQYQAIVD